MRARPLSQSQVDYRFRQMLSRGGFPDVDALTVDFDRPLPRRRMSWRRAALVVVVVAGVVLLAIVCRPLGEWLLAASSAGGAR